MERTYHLQKLDSVRGLAAFYVFLTHWSLTFTSIPEVIEETLLSFGQEAVMIFFVLSGFVIYFSTSKTPKIKFKDYFLKRFRRIYFPFSIAILLSLIIFYTNGNIGKYFTWEDLFGNFFMLQDLAFLKPGTWFKPFLGNLPLWSLSYEWWFYMMFFAVFTSRIFKSKYRMYVILLFSAIAYLIYLIYPNEVALICAYFITWWSGVELADIYIHKKRFTFKDIKPILICLLVMMSLTAVPVLATNNFRLGYYPFLVFRHFFDIFLIILIAWFWYTKEFVYFDATIGNFTFLVPISYGIYIFHYPIIKQCYWLNSIPNFWVLNAIKITLVIGLAYLVEIKLQPLVNRWLK